MTMLHRLTLAALRAMNNDPRLEWEDVHGGQKEIAEEVVRAVLGEMREPSGAMIEAGRPEIEYNFDMVDGSAEEYDTFARKRMLSAWQAMIDAALLDAPDGEIGRG